MKARSVVILKSRVTFNAIKDSKGHEYSLIGEYSDMENLLNNCTIDGIKFRDIIMDDNTQMIGKD